MAWFEDIRKEKNHPYVNEHRIKRLMLNNCFDLVFYL